MAKAKSKAKSKPAAKTAKTKAAVKPKAKVSAAGRGAPGKTAAAAPTSVKPVSAANKQAPVSLKPAIAEAPSAKVSTAPKPAKKTRQSKKQEENIEKMSQLGQKWSALYRKAQEKDSPAYNMRQSYEAKTSIMHKVLGWGYIMANKNDRLEVLFKDGIRYLISNYKN